MLHLPLTAWGLAGVGLAIVLVRTRRPPDRRGASKARTSILSALAGHPGSSPPREAGRTRARLGPGAGPGPGSGPGARWARRRDLDTLVTDGPRPGRLVLGTLARPSGRGGRHLLAAEVAQSVAVIGPTQSGKTTALAVPAILAWEGPVVAASVKTDLVRDTRAWRAARGSVWCFDPGRATGLPASRWTPLPAARTWAGARRVAADLTAVARGPGTTADGEFWYATAAKLLAPLLFAAASADLDMRDVVRWVDTQEMAEVADILSALGVVEALQAARATWQRDDRQRSSVYTTAETVLEPFAGGQPDGGAVPVPGPADVDVHALLLGTHTLYLCAPAHDQRRLRGLFTAVVTQVLDASFERSARLGAALTPPLLVVLDEAANIAPLVELDGLAATCAGHGIQLVTVWQDLAQVAARYGERAPTVINNHRAKIFLSGTSDPGTLDHASHLIGDEDLVVPSVTRDASGGRTVTGTPVQRRLLPPGALRRMPTGTGVLVYGSLLPTRLALRPWFDDPVLADRGARAAPPLAPPAGTLGRRARLRPHRSEGVQRPVAALRRAPSGSAGPSQPAGLLGLGPPRRLPGPPP